MALLTQLLNRDPLNGRALLTLSDLQAREGDMETALLTAERAARVAGFEAQGLVRQAQLEVGRGNYARAVPLLESAQAFEPRESVARYLEQVRRLAE
jgi:Flp pilus assembly protein TadD